MNSETTFRRFPCNTSTISTWSYPHIPSITFCLTSIILFLNNRYHIHFHFNTLLKPTSRASFHSNSYLMATPHSSTHASNTTYCTYNAKHYSMFLWLLIQLRMIIKPSYKNLSPTHSKCSCITKWLLGSSTLRFHYKTFHYTQQCQHQDNETSTKLQSWQKKILLLIDHNLLWDNYLFTLRFKNLTKKSGKW